MTDTQEAVQMHERVTRVETKVDAIMSNHLPHIQDKIDKVDSRTWWILGTVILGFVVSIVLMLAR